VVGVPYLSVTLERSEAEGLTARLRAEARLAGEALPWTGGPELDVACARLARDLDVRITVISPDGTVLGESERAAAGMENHADRPEVRRALAEGAGYATRRSATLGRSLLYLARRQEAGDGVRVVRLAVPLTLVAAVSRHVRRLVLASVIPALLLALVAAVILSRGMLRRIQRLVAFARRLAAGEPVAYIGPERYDDLGVLEAQLAEMARDVAATITALRVEQERLEAILRGMVEGVLVADLAGNVVLLNARARELLGMPPEASGRGRPLVELTREPALHELARELRAGAAVVTRDITLSAGEGRTLQANAARLSDPDGRAFGFVLVLHDVTELRRLEVVRRDFVANVSHELRTPLTAIKGYAETLLGPAGDDRETARRFLAVIDRHSERLGRLTDDLLTLSDLELGRTTLRLGPVMVGPVLDDVLQILSDRARRAEVRVSADVAPETPPALADGDRLRQVLINLVDNAIKYTPAGGEIVCRAAVVGPMVEVAIQDTGIGIPAQDLPRLTERFFRVDKARSRALGGTGLGLAIVKHIVQLHGGRLDVQSAVGRGTTVRVAFPAAAPDTALADDRPRMPSSSSG
jgi:two-component system phosphate regulon sensor histidine kinase PhoR